MFSLMLLIVTESDYPLRDTQKVPTFRWRQYMQAT